MGSADRPGYISIAGSQLAVGRRGSRPRLQINCACGRAKLHAGFGFGSVSFPAVKSSPNHRPNDCTWGLRNHLSLLFLTYLESRNHRRKSTIRQRGFWFFRAERAQEKEKERKKQPPRPGWCCIDLVCSYSFPWDSGRLFPSSWRAGSAVVSTGLL